MQVFLGLGSNLDDPVCQVKTAIDEIALLPDTKLMMASRLIVTAPMGPQDQPDYINAVVEIDTRLSAEALLLHLQKIEKAHHRQRTRHWGERTLDIDILLFGNEVIKTETLTIPHPGLEDREFVVYPLYEIAPDLVLPSKKSLADIYSKFPTGSFHIVS